MSLTSHSVSVNEHHSVPYSGKLLRQKMFSNSKVLCLFAKVFSTKFGGMVSFGVARVSNSWKFLRENHIFHQFVKVFSLESFPLYGNSNVIEPHNACTGVNELHSGNSSVSEPHTHNENVNELHNL